MPNATGTSVPATSTAEYATIWRAVAWSPRTTGSIGTRRRPFAHQRIDVAVEVVVEGARTAAREREAEDRHREGAERRDAGGTDERTRAARQQEQRHDARLRQRQVVAPDAAAGRS